MIKIDWFDHNIIELIVNIKDKKALLLDIKNLKYILHNWRFSLVKKMKIILTGNLARMDYKQNSRLNFDWEPYWEGIVGNLVNTMIFLYFYPHHVFLPIILLRLPFQLFFLNPLSSYFFLLAWPSFLIFPCLLLLFFTLKTLSIIQIFFSLHQDLNSLEEPCCSFENTLKCILLLRSLFWVHWRPQLSAFFQGRPFQ